jgi:hypothetical protein
MLTVITACSHYSLLYMCLWPFLMLLIREAKELTYESDLIISRYFHHFEHLNRI